MTAYPSDAPLPRFEVIKVGGCKIWTDSTAIGLRFPEAKIANFEEWASYWEAHGVTDCRTRKWNFRFSLSSDIGSTVGGIDFINGTAIPTDALGGCQALIWVNEWVRLSVETWNYYTVFEPPTYFCDVYVPNPGTMIPQVWTDLQFTVSPPTPEVPWIVIIPLAIFGVGALAYWYLKKRK